MAMTEPLLSDGGIDSDLLASELNRSLQTGFLRSGDYDSVTAVLVYWEDDDLNCSEEIAAMKFFFEDKWNYSAHIILIPGERSQATLQSELSRFVLLYGATAKSLLIVYYGGHGDASPDRKRAVWAARRKGGPTLNWYEVQPVVFAAEGDVLLLLDCCYAAQAARARENRTIELLAASGIKQRTPPPGEYSFTAVLLRVMNRMLQDKSHIVVSELYKRLFQETTPDEELAEQPFHFFLAEGGESIILKPKPELHALDRLQDAWPSALLSLTVSLSKKPDRSAMRRLGIWLKTAAPRTISSVEVESILLRTESIQEFLQTRCDSALHEVIKKDFNDSSQTERAEPVAPVLSRAHAISSWPRDSAEDILSTLKEWNNQVFQSLERHLLLNPAFATRESLDQLERDDSAQALGLDQAARMRILNMEDGGRPLPQDHMSLPFGAVTIQPLPKGACSAAAGELDRSIVTGVMHNDHVLIEFLCYGKRSDQSTVSLKVKRLASLLTQAQSPVFLLAPFVGYIHEPLKNRFGLVFRTDGEAKTGSNLNHINLHSMIGERRYMPLNRRLELAFSLARAMSALHGVGWIHKSFCSENIVFAFRTNDKNGSMPANGDSKGGPWPECFHSPMLFGFESARPTNAISSQTREFRHSRLLYMHPERWGRPSVAFGSLHDIYSLGVVLLEIGCWKQVSRMDRHGRGFSDRRDESEVRDELLAVAKDLLPHLAGELYSQVAIACLDNSLKDSTEGDSDRLGLHQAFGKRVLIPLGRCAYAQ